MVAPPGSPLAALEAAPFAVAMRQEFWLYPAVEIVHISGFVILVGSIVVFDLRLLGLTPEIPVRRLARHVLPWTLGAFLLIVPTGLLLFSAHAGDFLTNRAFQLKLLLIMLAGVNAGIFHTSTFRSVAGWDHMTNTPAAAKMHAVASLLLWFSVISCGRLLAYV
jgi:hypothetical protein